MDDFRHPLFQPVQVEDVDIGAFAHSQGAPIVETEHIGWHRANPAHGLLQAVDPCIASPVGQDECRPSGVDHLAHVRAGVAQARHRPIHRDQLLQGFEVGVESAEMEQRLAVGLVGNAQPGLHGMLPGGLRHVIQAFFRLVGVTGSLCITHPEPAFRRLQHGFALGLDLVDQLSPGFGVPDRLQAPIEVLFAQRVPSWRREKAVGRQAANAPAAPRHGDGGHLEAFGAHGHHLFVQAFGAELERRSE